jgi:hypothetical protein
MTDPDKDTCTIASVDFREKTITKIITQEKQKGVPEFLRKMAELAAKHEVQSVVIVTVEKGDAVDHYFEAVSEAHKALMALYLDDVKEDLKREVFNDTDL